MNRIATIENGITNSIIRLINRLWINRVHLRNRESAINEAKRSRTYTKKIE
jgi:hypothetical protein